MKGAAIGRSVLLRKLWADLRAARGRCAAAVLASALGVAVVLALLLAQHRLRQDMRLNYLGTAPASAQLLLPAEPTPATVAGLAALPGITAAEAGLTLRARVARGDGPWRAALLFMVPERQPPQIGRPALQSGVWQADDAHLLVERDALRLLGALPGDTLRLALSEADAPLTVAVGAAVHDPALAPASMEGVVYAYAGPALVARLPGAVPQHLLQLRFADLEAAIDRGEPRNAVQAQADDRARAAAAWLAAQGLSVTELRVPPIGNHPHGFQARSTLAMLVGFGTLALLAAALLSTALMRGLLEQQGPQIGVLRVLGASTAQLVAQQAVLALLLGLAGTALAVPIGLLAGQALVSLSQQLLNLRPLAPAVPGWWWALGLALGLGVPLLATLLPLRQALRRPPRQALGRPDLARGVAFRPPLAWPVALRLAVLEGLRRWRRLALTVAMLGTAGAVLVASLDLRQSWADLADRASLARHWQLEMRLFVPADRDDPLPWLRSQPGVRAAEDWSVDTALWAEGGELPLSRTYPDGGHGRMLLRQTPPGSTLTTPALLQGRWLTADDVDGVVINRGALLLRGAPAQPGERVTLAVGGQRRSWQLVGVIDEPVTAPTAYVLPMVDAGSAGGGARQLSVRVQLVDIGAAESAAAALTQGLAARGVIVRGMVTDRQMKRSANGHLLLLVRSLAAVAVSVALVGLIGLGSALGTMVSENHQALAVLRALGATPAVLAGTVLALAGLVAAASLLPMLLLAWPVSWVMVQVVGQTSGLLLLVAAAWTGPALWAAVLAAAALAAAVGPARQARRLSVREALADRG